MFMLVYTFAKPVINVQAWGWKLVTVSDKVQNIMKTVTKTYKIIAPGPAWVPDLAPRPSQKLWVYTFWWQCQTFFNFLYVIDMFILYIFCLRRQHMFLFVNSLRLFIRLVHFSETVANVEAWASKLATVTGEWTTSIKRQKGAKT